MRGVRLFLCVCLFTMLAGCMISEQIGEPVGRGNSRMAGKDVTIHFDTDFNRILLFGRSALLAGLGIWIFSQWGKSAGGILVGAVLVGVAGWLAIQDYPSLSGYRISVEESGLILNIPSEIEERIPWNEVEALELAGFEYGRVGGGTRITPFGSPQRLVGAELPAWETMTITLAGGQTRRIDLKRLSIEHRQIFAQALIKRAGMVDEDDALPTTGGK